ncbi:hypothetical protein QW131_06565 [Roseibium salinum]|nr:hypothetical protein [Roseibium salinum]
MMKKVAALGRRHLESIEEIFARALDPQNPDAVRDKARAYSSLAIGTLALRKAGIPADRIADTLKTSQIGTLPVGRAPSQPRNPGDDLVSHAYLWTD